MKKANGNGLDIQGFQPIANGVQLGRVHWVPDFAARQNAFRDFEGQAAGNQRPMPMKEQIVGFRAVAAADGINIARALGDEEGRLGALALDQRVDRLGGPVDDVAGPADFETTLVDTVEDTLGQVVGGCRALCLIEALGHLVKGHQVGEGAADVDRQ